MLEISRMKLDALENALNRLSYDDLDGIHIYEETDRLIRDREERKNAPMMWGVNWGAHGTQSAKNACEYARKLQEAADIANVLNSLELKRPGWDDDSDAETYRKASQDFYAILKVGSADPNMLEAYIRRQEVL